MIRKKHYASQGQALVEFALIAIVLLMIVFLIVEASRILWAWITVQNAARSGARYAVTGNFEPGVCPTEDIIKYSWLCDDDELKQRPASIIEVSYQALGGLPINEVTEIAEDDNFYLIQVFGVDETGVLHGGPFFEPEPFAGTPNNPVIVRVWYNVPIITPLFRPILRYIPVFGQTVLYNEPFGQLGGTGQSAGLPPPIPALPTPGVTPSFTPTPTIGPSPTPSQTPTASPTATDVPCPVRYTSALVAGTGFASVTGLYDAGGSSHIVTFYDITVNPGETNPLGSTVMVPATGGSSACPGVGDTSTAPLVPLLIEGHIIRARSTDGSFADAIVQQGTNTPTASPTSTATASPAPSNTPTPTLSPTPSGPFIQLAPNCGFAPTAQIIVSGFNWPTSQAINLFFNGSPRDQILPGHPGHFQRTWVVNVANNSNNIVLASTTTQSSSKTFVVPCPSISPTPITATPTGTPEPADLIIAGQPLMISTPPIVEYRPVSFQVAITNTGQVDVNNQFFVDLYFDPTVVYSDSIPLSESSGYVAIGSLGGGASRVITITSETGFTGGDSERLVYGMVDSLEAIDEIVETNNVTGGLPVTVTPADPPTPSPTPDGTNFATVSGIVYSYIGNWVPQYRAIVWLQNETNPAILFGPVFSDQNGVYTFNSVPTGTSYTAVGCLPSADADFVFVRPAIIPPHLSASLFMQPDGAGCPLP
jgi:hypothetical protein